MPSYDQMLLTVQTLQSLSDMERRILFFMYDGEKGEFYFISEGTGLLFVTITEDCQKIIETETNGL